MKGVYKFTESSTLTPGNKVTTFEIDGVKCGVAICFDINFGEFFHLYRLEGVQLMFVPSAFNTYFGPMQWDLLNRGRANDNQFFLVAISPARSTEASYEVWGYTMFINPFGKILAQAEEKERTLFYELGKGEYIRLLRNE